MPKVENFLDTNILVYAFSDDPRSEVARVLMAGPFAISTQALNEFANVTRKKLKLPWEQIEDAIDALSQAASSIVFMDPEMTRSALRLADRYNLAFYDSLMVAAALSAGCRNYYSEDLHHGLTIDGMLSVINPFRIE
jgi:predicted nucleic acid-binding protein